jgi:putative cell wall-binding protein
MLKLLQPATIYLTGGSGAVSDNVKLTVKAMFPNASIQRFSGADRYETARDIYSDGSGWSSQAIVVDGSNYADALSIAPYAYAAKCPIFLSDRTSGLDSSSLKDILGGGFSSVILVGGRMHWRARPGARRTARFSSLRMTPRRAGNASKGI